MSGPAPRLEEGSTFWRPGYRVRLRPIVERDVDAMMDWVNDPAVTRNFAGMSRTITREEELAYVRSMRSSSADRLYVAEDLDGRYVGNGGIHKIYWPAANGRLGLVIGDRARHGQGYGQEVLRLLCTLAFEHLQLHKVWIVHYGDNGRMLHLCKKLGFLEEGVLRDEYFHQDAWHDMLRHSLLRGDYDDAPWRER